MTYDVGIDLGATTVVAAVLRDQRVRIAPLTDENPVLSPTLMVDGDAVVVGVSESEVADARQLVTDLVTDLAVAGEVEVADRRIPVVELVTAVLRRVLHRIDELEGDGHGEGGPLGTVVLAHPAVWDEGQVASLLAAARAAGASSPCAISSLEAAAIRYASPTDGHDGDRVLVADYGGGGFQAGVLRRVGDRFAPVAEPVAVAEAGGIDVDDAVLGHVMHALGDATHGLDPDDAADRRTVAALAERCVDAKERLSDLEAVEIDVSLRGHRSVVRLDRAGLAELALPVLRPTVGPLRDVLASSGTRPAELRAVHVVGGGGSLPVVPGLVSEALGVDVTVDDHAQFAVALGAAMSASLGPPPAAGRVAAAARPGVDRVGVRIPDEPRPDGPDHDTHRPDEIGRHEPGELPPEPPEWLDPEVAGTAVAGSAVAGSAVAGSAGTARSGRVTDDVERALYPDVRLVRMLWLVVGAALVVAAVVGGVVLSGRDESSGGVPETTVDPSTTGPSTPDPASISGATGAPPAPSTTGPPEATTVDAARATVAAFAIPSDDLGLTEPLPALPGPARIDFLRLDQGDGPAAEPDVLAAASALGLDAAVIPLGATIESAVAGWQQAADELPDAVVGAGVPLALVETQAATLFANGVPVVVWASPDEPASGVTENLVGPDDYQLNGRILADVVATGDGPAGVVLYTQAGPVFEAVEAGFRAELTVTCPTCTLEVVPVADATVGLGFPAEVVSYVQSHPELGWVVLGVGQMAVGVPEALEAAGLTGRVQILSQSGGPLNAAYVAAGRQHGDVTFPTGILGYRAVDAVARALIGAPPGAPATPFPRRLLTPATVADVDPVVGWRGPPGFEQRFLTLWGLA